jgi:alkylation response protein AidB-like acyl-CoA dehydrogenase
MITTTGQQGGAFLLEDISPEEIYTPEDFNETQLMIGKTTEDFCKNEIAPHADKLEHKDFDLQRQIMKKAGDLGLIGADIKEEFGGSGMDKVSSTLIAANSAGAESVAVTWMCHTGIGSMPLVFFGNKAQREKYLPPLAAGTAIGAYALTEPSAGSDALSIKTKAVLSPDKKHYILNGEKQFITNGGFADTIFVYAKVDGDKFTSFIVERNFKGVSIGPEEKKMGMRGSSTTPVIFEDAQVPVENVLYEIGQGHIVAFCILDMGRFKLAATCAGSCKLALEQSIKYAKQRIQFGKPISSFGMIKQKLADMAIKSYISESMVYRTADLLEKVLTGVDLLADGQGKEISQRISGYSVECSINKIFASEALSSVVDETVQIHGGYGYIEDYGAEKMYRNSRINRIWEGTNEINRMVIPGWLLRKALKNELPLFAVATKLAADLLSIPAASPAMDDGPLGYQKKLVGMAKKIFVLVCGGAAQKYGKAISDEQEILALLANITIEVYAMESGLLRAQKALAKSGEEKAKLKIDMVQAYINESMRKVEDYATQVLVAMETGDTLNTMLSALKKFARMTPVNTVAAKRRVADAVIAAEKFVC